MSEHVVAHWQVQEAKQHLSEVLRAVARDGPQTITRHGQEVAVVIAIDEYRRLAEPRKDLREVLLGPPYLDDDAVCVLDEIETDRRHDLPREIDLGIDR
jgi:prevent-host-death family protein